MYSDQPRHTLGEIVAQYGDAVVEDPRRCRALLMDLCGTHRQEISVLVMALEEQVAVELRSPQPGTPIELLLARLTQRLVDHRALTHGAARWAVESWALALGLCQLADLAGGPVVFSSTWKVDVLSRPHADRAADWKKIDTTPGRVTVPSGYELGLRPYGVDGDAFGAWVQELDDAHQVRHLDLRWMGVADRDLAYLRAFTGLVSLDLAGTQVTDAGLIRLRALKALTSLSLAYTRITDARLVHLRALPGLTRLDLRWTRISNRGLVHVRALSGLKYLDLTGCKQITEEGVASLRRPGLSVVR